MSEDYNNQNQSQDSFNQQPPNTGEPTRVKKSNSRNWFIIILVVLLFLIVLVPTAAMIYMKLDNQKNTVATTQSSSVVMSSDSTSSTELAKNSTEASTNDSSSTMSSNSSSGLTKDSTSTSTSSTEKFSDVEVPVGQTQVQNPDPIEPDQSVAQDTTNQGQDIYQQDADQNVYQAQAPAQPAGGDYVYYGEGSNISLWSIARNNGLFDANGAPDVNRLYELNPNISSQAIQYGDPIRIR